ncbi:MAG: sulfide/dihydroorotate dehydrogenase-like FAD/NAD-binding protein [Candidatus Omnitrophica bacterium]|nr:sulfide/dihydroorotate dehydrogenase-like FAD/NAD-binding protein [Candidatus Omnitrophota bacterium]
MKITRKDILTKEAGPRITRIEILSPDIARKARPGQFIALMVNEKGERIPLTIVDATQTTITLIFQEAGLSTRLLGKLNVGDSLYSLVGPLGHATEIKNYGSVILVGGGVGIAEIYPVAKALKKAGNHVTTILGARTKELLILEKKLASVSDELHITTDDGSYGKKGFVTDVLKELLTHTPKTLGTYGPTALVYAVGPIPMMKRVAMVTKDSNVKTIVSLNAIMIDATGMCGCCRVSVDGKVKFSCIDGPEFDGHLVDWTELEKRTKVYTQQEKHICNLSK